MFWSTIGTVIVSLLNKSYFLYNENELKWLYWYLLRITVFTLEKFSRIMTKPYKVGNLSRDSPPDQGILVLLIFVGKYNTGSVLISVFGSWTVECTPTPTFVENKTDPFHVPRSTHKNRKSLFRLEGGPFTIPVSGLTVRDHLTTLCNFGGSLYSTFPLLTVTFFLSGFT